MVTENDLFPIPEFERRTNEFIKKVEEVQEDDENFKWHCVSFLIEKTYPNMISGFDGLQIIIDKDGGLDLPLQPRDLADELDIEAATSCVVSVSSIMDSYEPLAEFARKLHSIAEEHNCKIDGTMYFGTEGEPDMVRVIDVEIFGRLFRSCLYFRFE